MRSLPRPDWLNPGAVVVAAIILVLVASLGYAFTSPEYQATVERNDAEAQAYCGLVHGDSEVYVAQTIGGHGGYHCATHTVDGHPHLHDVPAWAKQDALAAQRGHLDVDRDQFVERVEHEVAQRPWHEQPSNSLWVSAAVALALTLAFAGAVQLHRRWSHAA